MATISWKLTEKQEKYINDKHKYLLVEGSAGSGKTIFAVHKVILYALTHKNARIGVFRQTLPSLRMTAWLEIRDALDNYGIPYKENKSEGVMRFPTGSTISFKGLDDPQKIRSLNLDYVYVEQAEEISKDVFNELESRVRGKASMKDYGQLLLVITPATKAHWIYKRFHLHKDDPKIEIIHFHYTDNSFVGKEYIEMAEERKKYDYDNYIRLTLGLWQDTGGLIYQHYDIKDSYKGFEFYTGCCDFGFNNPSCFLLLGWLDGECYVIDEVYQSHLINHQFIAEVLKCLRRNNLNPNNVDTVYCDSAEPDRIQEFCDYGFNAIGGIKNVNAKIEAVKSCPLHISDKCVNTIREIESYCYQKDKDGNDLDKPIKYNDHSMDALGYGIYGTVGILSADRLNKDPVQIYSY